MIAKVITIAQQKGGAGKTTVTAHLAVALAQKGLQAAAIDIDPQGSLTQWHRLREQRLGMENTGLSFSSVTGWRLPSEIHHYKNTHDIILVDSPPHIESEARAAIRLADMVIVPMQPSPADLWATQATVSIAVGERKPVRIVLNRVMPNTKLSQRIPEYVEGLSKRMLGNRVAFASAFMDGRTAQELAPSSPAAQEVSALTREVLRTLSNQGKKRKAAGKRTVAPA